MKRTKINKKRPGLAHLKTDEPPTRSETFSISAGPKLLQNFGWSWHWQIHIKSAANFWGIRINLHQMCLFILGRLRPITICDIRNRFEPDLSRFLRHETVRNGPSCVMERMEETSSITFRLSSNPILLFPGVLKRNVATHKNFFSQKIWKSFYSSTSVLVPPRKKEPQSHVSHLGKSS